MWKMSDNISSKNDGQKSMEDPKKLLDSSRQYLKLAEKLGIDQKYDASQDETLFRSLLYLAKHSAAEAEIANLKLAVKKSKIDQNDGEKKHLFRLYKNRIMLQDDRESNLEVFMSF